MDNRMSSEEPPSRSGSKRKGTRSVSTLTPSQLARKRANDREAQRAIRARTKDLIERLQQEVEELKSQQGRDKTVQELMRRNNELESELRRLKESIGMPLSSPTSYSAPAGYDETMSIGSGPLGSPRTSPFPSGDYTSMPDLGQQYVSLHSNNCEAWASTVSNPVSSTVSSPSSAANTDDYSTAAYIPTSVPSSMMHSHSSTSTSTSSNRNNNNNSSSSSSSSNSSVASRSHPSHHHHHAMGKEIKMEAFDDLDGSEAGLRLGNVTMPATMAAHAFLQQQHQQHHQHQQHQQHQPQHQAAPQQWGMPAYEPMYYSQVPSLVH